MNALDICKDVLSVIGSASIVWVLGQKVFRWFKKVDNRKKLCEFHQEENRLLMRCVLRIFDGLIQLGANGPVSDARDEVEKFLVEKGVIS